MEIIIALLASANEVWNLWDKKRILPNSNVARACVCVCHIAKITTNLICFIQIVPKDDLNIGDSQ